MIKKELLFFTILATTHSIVSSAQIDLRSVIARTSASNKKKDSRLRGAAKPKRPGTQNRRALKGGGKSGGGGHGHGHGHPSHMGCLYMSDSELAGNWTFSGQAPNCSYVHVDSDGDGSSNGNSNGGNGNGGNGNGNGNGGNGNGGNGNGGNGNGGNGNGNGGNGNGGNGNSNGGNTNGDDDDTEQVVSNEDVQNGEDLDPYEDFQLDRCDTYKNLWMWDLSLSCQSESNLNSCNCTFAEELMGLGLLSCDDQEDCPSDCPICSTCLSLVGCEPPTNLLQGPKISTSVWLYIAGALILLLIILLALFHNRRRAQQENELKKNLMAGEKTKEGYQASQDDNIEPWENPAGSGMGPSTSKTATLAAAGVAANKGGSDDDSDSDASGDNRTVRTSDETFVQSVDGSSTAPTIPTKDS